MAQAEPETPDAGTPGAAAPARYRAEHSAARGSTAPWESAEAADPARSELPKPVTGALADDGVTLVQISTTFCAPCRHTRAVLRTLAETTPGLHHVDLDITERPHVGAQLGVLRTPTTVAYTADGTELLRVDGVPKLDRLRPALWPLVQAHSRPTE